MELISKFNEGFRFFYVLLTFIVNMYGSFNRLQDKKGVTITNDESNRNRIHIEMYSTQNEGKSVIAKRFIRTLKNKIYKYMTSVSKNVYIDKLDDLVNKYNNANHSTIKMKPVDVKSNSYIESSK